MQRHAGALEETDLLPRPPATGALQQPGGEFHANRPSALVPHAFEAGAAHPDIHSRFPLRVPGAPVTAAFTGIRRRKLITLAADARRAEFARIVGPVRSELVPSLPDERRTLPENRIPRPQLGQLRQISAVARHCVVRTTDMRIGPNAESPLRRAGFPLRIMPAIT
jgi:hypothetical protein